MALKKILIDSSRNLEIKRVRNGWQGYIQRVRHIGKVYTRMVKSSKERTYKDSQNSQRKEIYKYG